MRCIINKGNAQLLRTYYRQCLVNNEHMKDIIYYDLEKSIGTGQKGLNNFYRNHISIPIFSKVTLTY